jgi:hypothetical protein
MELAEYLKTFQKTADQIYNTSLKETDIDIKAGIWLNAPVIKLQKKDWANAALDKGPAGPSIFFSIWTGDKAIKENKILYNIHALKLRKLNGYTITSREFAAAFRERFKPFEHAWPNVSTAFGPLTLMEGWEKCNPEDPGNIIINLVNQFLKIDFIIDNLLNERKKVTTKP